jgi:diaminopimelate epimerase
MITLPLTHCHGSGNDFPLIDARALPGDIDWSIVARLLADRAGPVGGDGLLLLTAGDADHAFGMRMLNSDGSESEQCLNGLRCVARAGFETARKIGAGIDRARVRLKTSSAEVWREAELATGVVTIGERVGPAGLDVADWPLTGAGARVIDAPVPPLDRVMPAGSGGRRFTAVAMPNPHLVSFVERIDEAELVRLGMICESAPDWLPNRANVSFVEQRGPDVLWVRTHERGVGLTNSCGSAMGASTYAAALTGRTAWGMDVTVLNRGGRVRARAEADGTVTLAGNATWEWAGEVDLDAGAVREVRVARRFADEVAAWAVVRGGQGQPAGDRMPGADRTAPGPLVNR